jgi:hypothetical protein
MNLPKVSFNLNKFFVIMFFYIVLSYLIGPVVGYYTLGKSAAAAGHGFVIGSLISIALWYSVGKKLV